MIPKRWIEEYLRFLLRNRLAVTVVVTIMTIFFAYETTRVRIVPQFLDFYPGPSKVSIFGHEYTWRKGHPYIAIYNTFRRMFGSANILTVILEVKHGDIYNPTTLQKMDVITKRLVETKGVVPYQILSIAHPKMKSLTTYGGAIQVREVFFPGVPQTQEDADRVKFAVYSTKGIRGLYVAQDDTAALVNAGFWEEELDFNYLYDRMMQLKHDVEDDDHVMLITGFPWLYTSIQRYVPQVSQVFVLTVAALGFLLWNYFRTWTGIWVPMFSGLLSGIWALAFGPLLGLNLDPKQVFTVVQVDGKPAIRISGEMFGALTGQQEYSDFHLRLEFKWGEKKWPPRENVVRDSGILYYAVGPHGASPNKAWMRSLECQVQEHDVGDYWGVAGAIVDVAGERRTVADGKEPLIHFRKGAPALTVEGPTPRAIKAFDNEKPTGEWNTVEVLCLRGTCVHAVNGRVNLVLTNPRQPADGGAAPLRSGRLQLQTEGAEVFYRNIAVRPITEFPKAYRQ